MTTPPPVKYSVILLLFTLITTYATATDVAYSYTTSAYPAFLAASSISKAHLTSTSTLASITINKKKKPKAIVKKAPTRAKKSPILTKATSTLAEITRIQAPYSFPQFNFEQINNAARVALVNILCMPRSGSMRPISGSGILIDSRGIILTNAHVAQYVLLSQNNNIDLTCSVRTGAPAQARWTVAVLYIPPVWVRAHAADINANHPTGTGEHDYALLRITGSLNGSPLPAALPYLPFDIRDGIGFVNDQVLGAAYPAEFASGLETQGGLYPVTSISNIQKMLTFQDASVDLISLGGVMEAQGGSSGGAVLNAWGQLIAMISTTSDAPTTAARDLRAITLSYINRDIAIQSGKDLSTFLNSNLDSLQSDFDTTNRPEMFELYLKQIPHSQ